MTKDKLNDITIFIKGVMCNAYDYDTESLLRVIASLHNELYKIVTGEYYDYMFHWYNKATGGIIEDDLFKEDNNETLC